METNEIKKLENLRQLTVQYCSTLTPCADKTGTYTAKIKMHNYHELGCTITEMLKLCIVALDHDVHQATTLKQSPINVALVLEMVLEMFPLDELEFLSNVAEILSEE
ncbi:hypothetical protein GJU43_12810 [Flavobacterium sp. LC2016-23]|uniref:hypothetical protein n=1 Tax=Flavobacterium sp. LC2016-23 TaxID=2666330 RepID=UPI0012B01F48|nr:hypothetical protein [Flavobacterium sp. LC2016-23]MRX40161.1 hypothetical protein [Flavobacterium sp. LC2016-23]